MVEDTIVNIAAIIALVLPPFSVWAAFRLWRIARAHPNIVSLQERSQSAIILAIASLLGGLVATNRLIAVGTSAHILSNDVQAMLLAAIIITCSVPNIVWAITYTRNHFSDGKH
jgi:hypothetical protein